MERNIFLIFLLTYDHKVQILTKKWVVMKIEDFPILKAFFFFFSGELN